VTADPALLARTLPVFAQLAAPARWRTIEFISDLHLQTSEPETFEAWKKYMRETAADAVFILGDLFEVWVGDDAAREPGFEADSGAVLRATAQRADVFFMHGNRDFLVGDAFLRSCGAQPLADPTVLDFAGKRWVLTHGDALCLADAGYMKFRSEVRNAAWQEAFLARPLAQRQAIARDLRKQSEEAQRANGGQGTYSDVDEAETAAWLDAAHADAMIHGHTHRPADHPLAGRTRTVLSDWHADAHAPRLEVLRIDAGGTRRVRLA
jgi:UDP-2,3-diacylglucosamine hydrolase